MGRPKTILVRRSETIRSSSSRKDYQESWWSHYIGGCWIFPAGLIAVIAIIALLVHRDRKSTRLNSSHVAISYAVFCLKKKKKINKNTINTKSTGRSQFTYTTSTYTRRS